MKQEDKDILLRDLCAKIPYGVKVQAYNYEHDIETIETLYEINSDGYMSTLECDTFVHISKPYLFPLSSMTEEQKKEYHNLCIEEEREQREFGKWVTRVYYHNTIESIDWLNAHHFDYRSLIDKGLAIDCTNLNIY